MRTGGWGTGREERVKRIEVCCIYTCDGTMKPTKHCVKREGRRGGMGT
jgi:hypothetical protein